MGKRMCFRKFKEEKDTSLTVKMIKMIKRY